jgi:hypothetical protein
LPASAGRRHRLPDLAMAEHVTAISLPPPDSRHSYAVIAISAS